MGHKRLPVVTTVEGEECPLPPDVQVALYRVVQEALNNVAKHAHATRIELGLRCGDGEVEVCIDDDGRGFEQDRVLADHFGLRIMRERADAIGATLAVHSQPGHGTQVRVLWRGETPCR
jgi:signal transduction histidine kinase